MFDINNTSTLGALVLIDAESSKVSEGEKTTEETKEIINIKILNGKGTPALASTLGDFLENHFNTSGKILQVVETGNADNFDYKTTEIIVYNSEEEVLEMAQSIQELLDLGEIIISESKDYNQDIGISIIIGWDYVDEKKNIIELKKILNENGEKFVELRFNDFLYLLTEGDIFADFYSVKEIKSDSVVLLKNNEIITIFINEILYD